MKTDKNKKNKGLKLLKVEQAFFQNPKKIDLKLSLNNRSLNSQTLINHNNNNSLFRNSLRTLNNKKEEEKNSILNSTFLIKNVQKMNSFKSYKPFSKKNSAQTHQLFLIKKYLNQNEEEKSKKVEYSPYKYSYFKYNSKTNRNPSKFVNKKAISTKTVKNWRNSLFCNKSTFNNDIMNSNINKNKNISKIKKENINSEENKINKDDNEIKTKIETINTENENEGKIITKIKKMFFCCL